MVDGFVDTAMTGTYFLTYSVMDLKTTKLRAVLLW